MNITELAELACSGTEEDRIDSARKAADLLSSSPVWTIFTHKKADGDAIGAGGAMLGAARLLGKRAAWVSPDSLPKSLDFMPHFCDCRVYDAEAEGDFPFRAGPDTGLCVFLDCGNENRSVSGFAGRDRELTVLNIDHHSDNTMFGDVNCVDPKCSSTCELLVRVLGMMKLTPDSDVAESLYTGIWTDSGGFSFSNTTPATHAVAAGLMMMGNISPSATADRIRQTRTPQSLKLWARAFERVRLIGSGGHTVISYLLNRDFDETGAYRAENEGLVNALMELRDAAFAALLTEQPDGTTRGSFRSRRGSICAGEMAHRLGGGGHECAAGATLETDIDSAVKLVTDIMEKNDG